MEKQQKRKYVTKKSLSAEGIIEDVRNGNINPYINQMAKKYNISWVIMREFVEENEELKAIIDFAKAELEEQAEQNIMEILLDKKHYQHAQISKWVLSVRNHKYKDKQEVEVDGEINIKIERA